MPNAVNGVFYYTAPDELLSSGVDDVGHDATLGVSSGPNTWPVSPAPPIAKRNSITPAEAWSETESGALDFRPFSGARIESNEEVRIISRRHESVHLQLRGQRVLDPDCLNRVGNEWIVVSSVGFEVKGPQDSIGLRKIGKENRLRGA